MTWGYVNGGQSAYLFRLNLFADLRCEQGPVVEHADACGGQVRVRHTWLAVGLEHLVGVLLDCPVLKKQRQPQRDTERQRKTERLRDRDTERETYRDRARDGSRESEDQTQATG